MSRLRWPITERRLGRARVPWPPDRPAHARQPARRAAEARLLTKFSLTVFKTKMEDILYASGGTAQIDARIRYMIQSSAVVTIIPIDRKRTIVKSRNVRRSRAWKSKVIRELVD